MSFDDSRAAWPPSWPLVADGLRLNPRDIALREVLPATVVSPAAFGTILGIRQLPDGRVLVNDGERRQLVLLDQQLRVARVVLDSAADGGNGYGPRASPLIPYLVVACV